MPATTALLNAIINYQFGGQTGASYIPPPSTIYFGLSTTVVTAAGIGSVTEPAEGAGYARASGDNLYSGGSMWGDFITTDRIQNDTTISFGPSSSSWGTIVSIFVSDSATIGAGNVLWYYTFPDGFFVANEITTSFDAGTIIPIEEYWSTWDIDTGLWMYNGTTKYSSDNILTYNFGKYQTSAPPTTMYFGLSTTLCNYNGIRSAREPTDDAYARVAYTNNSTKWGTSTVGTLHNEDAIVFPKSGESWGIILSLFIADASTDGNMLWFKKLPYAIRINENTSLSFPASSIVITGV